MLFMRFKLGPDMALCLIKSILFALLAAFIPARNAMRVSPNEAIRAQ